MHQIKLFFLFCFLTASSFAASTIQLVESTPVNTTYQQSTLADTETVWLAMVNEAKQSIDIGSFFLATRPHSSMEYFIQALNKAADSGVKIRILLDKSMQQQSAEAVNELNNKITVRYINYKNLTGGVMHAKYMIIDGHDSFIGSQNFGWKAMSQNHELGVQIDNPHMGNNLEQLFNLDWQLSQLNNFRAAKKVAQTTKFFNAIRSHNPTQIADATLYPAFSPKDFIPRNVDWELPRLLNLIDSAQQQILIQVYQYSDLSGYQGRNRWQSIDKALTTAAKRGVKIKLMVSDAMLNSKAGLRGLNGLQNISNIEVKISAIPIYQGKHGAYTRVDHAKFMIIDNTISWIGTGNWQKNYFYKSRDIAIIINSRDINSQLKSIFWQHWNSKYTKKISG